jgi:hypothetical protein
METELKPALKRLFHHPLSNEGRSVIAWTGFASGTHEISFEKHIFIQKYTCDIYFRVDATG